MTLLRQKQRGRRAAHSKAQEVRGSSRAPVLNCSPKVGLSGRAAEPGVTAEDERSAEHVPGGGFTGCGDRFGVDHDLTVEVLVFDEADGGPFLGGLENRADAFADDGYFHDAGGDAPVREVCAQGVAVDQGRDALGGGGVVAHVVLL